MHAAVGDGVQMKERQQATALYLIDKLALRAGGEKDADEQADTVGCCSLRLEHISAAAAVLLRRSRPRRAGGAGRG